MGVEIVIAKVTFIRAFSVAIEGLNTGLYRYRRKELSRETVDEFLEE